MLPNSVVGEGGAKGRGGLFLGVKELIFYHSGEDAINSDVLPHFALTLALVQLPHCPNLLQNVIFGISHPKNRGGVLPTPPPPPTKQIAHPVMEVGVRRILSEI